MENQITSPREDERAASPHEEDEILVTINCIRLHLQKPRKPKSWFRKVLQAHTTGKPQRAFGKLEHMKDGRIVGHLFDSPADYQIPEKYKDAPAKNIRLVIPPGGIPVLPGEDVIEYMQSQERKTRHRNSAHDQKRLDA